MARSRPSLTVVWGLNGVRAVRDRPVHVVVDVLSFSSAVVAGCSSGAVIFPYQWRDQRAKEYADSVGATLATHRQDSHLSPGCKAPPTLSPVSLANLSPGYRLVLPSPNGSTLAAASEAETVIAGCLRNASAVASHLNDRGQDVAVVAAGEQWTDGSLRVALEDLLGAGAIVSGWRGRKCIDAVAAEAVFQKFSNDLEMALSSTTSGRELIERRFQADVEFAALLDADTVVPILKNRAFHAYGEAYDQ